MKTCAEAGDFGEIPAGCGRGNYPDHDGERCGVQCRLYPRCDGHELHQPEAARAAEEGRGGHGEKQRDESCVEGHRTVLPAGFHRR